MSNATSTSKSSSSISSNGDNNDDDDDDDNNNDNDGILLTEYKYSGTSKKCHVCDPNIPQELFVMELCNTVADCMYRNLHLCRTNLKSTTNTTTTATATATTSSSCHNTTTTSNSSNSSSSSTIYNGCLVNWYEPHHTIGLHADDEKELDNNFPIMSLSWGGPRRFLVRPKNTTAHYNNKVTDILLKDGDWIVMGGKCQEEFKHEVPKLRKCDGPSSQRISWTIRKMIPTSKTK